METAGFVRDREGLLEGLPEGEGGGWRCWKVHMRID